MSASQPETKLLPYLLAPHNLEFVDEILVGSDVVDLVEFNKLKAENEKLVVGLNEVIELFWDLISEACLHCSHNWIDKEFEFNCPNCGKPKNP